VRPRSQPKAFSQSTDWNDARRSAPGGEEAAEGSRQGPFGMKEGRQVVGPHRHGCLSRSRDLLLHHFGFRGELRRTRNPRPRGHRGAADLRAAHSWRRNGPSSGSASRSAVSSFTSAAASVSAALRDRAASSPSSPPYVGGDLRGRLPGG
jgi:hypothetical protein